MRAKSKEQTAKSKDVALIQAAKKAARRAYAPYSKFRVGAAVLAKSGKVFAGCNVENASYGLTICAERSAIFSAIATGEREFERIVIFAPTQQFTGPCGACRQVMAEFAPNLEVVLVNKQGKTRSYSLKKLLPAQFKL